MSEQDIIQKNETHDNEKIDDKWLSDHDGILVEVDF